MERREIQDLVVAAFVAATREHARSGRTKTAKQLRQGRVGDNPAFEYRRVSHPRRRTVVVVYLDGREYEFGTIRDCQMAACTIIENDDRSARVELTLCSDLRFTKGEGTSLEPQYNAIGNAVPDLFLSRMASRNASPDEEITEG